MAARSRRTDREDGGRDDRARARGLRRDGSGKRGDAGSSGPAPGIEPAVEHLYYSDPSSYRPSLSHTSTDPVWPIFYFLNASPAAYDVTVEVDGASEVVSLPPAVADAMTSFDVFFDRATHPSNPTPGSCL